MRRDASGRGPDVEPDRCHEFARCLEFAHRHESNVGHSIFFDHIVRLGQPHDRGRQAVCNRVRVRQTCG